MTRMEAKPTKPTRERRSPAQRIDDLKSRLSALEAKVEARQRKDMPVVVEAQKVRRMLRQFAELAHKHGRADVGLMVEAFSAGLTRSIEMPPDAQRRRRDERDEDA